MTTQKSSEEEKTTNKLEMNFFMVVKYMLTVCGIYLVYKILVIGSLRQLMGYTNLKVLIVRRKDMRNMKIPTRLPFK